MASITLIMRKELAEETKLIFANQDQNQKRILARTKSDWSDLKLGNAELIFLTAFEKANSQDNKNHGQSDEHKN